MAGGLATTLRKYLSERGSPLAPHVNDLIRAGRRYKVDPRLIVAIANAETSLGKAGAGPAVHNAWGIGPGRAYQTWAQGINAMAKLLRQGYLNEGRNSFTSLYPKYVWGKTDKQGDPNADWVRNASSTYAELGGNPNNVNRGWRNASAPAVSGASFQMPPAEPPKKLTARTSFDPLDPSYGIDALRRISEGGSAVSSFRSMVKAMDWAQQMAQPLSTSAPKTKVPDEQKTPSGPAPVSGKVIGTPNTGTHTLGNWESDNAVDVAVPYGTPIKAVANGRIGSQFGPLGSGDPRFAGLRLHLVGQNNEWYYAHLSRFASGIRPGSHVRKGDVIGYSGQANGVNHLHFAQEFGSPLSYFD